MIDINKFYLKYSEIELRRIYKDDLEDLYKAYSDVDVMKYTSDSAFESFSIMDKFFQSVEKGYKTQEFYEFALLYKGKVVGTCSIHSIGKEKSSAEIGYILCKDYWKRGIMTQALKGLIEFCFEKLELKRLYADIEIENIASRELALRLGFKHVEGSSSLFHLDAISQ